MKREQCFRTGGGDGICSSLTVPLSTIHSNALRIRKDRDQRMCIVGVHGMTGLVVVLQWDVVVIEYLCSEVKTGWQQHGRDIFSQHRFSRESYLDVDREP
jgi:hypothetical protein